MPVGHLRFFYTWMYNCRDAMDGKERRVRRAGRL